MVTDGLGKSLTERTGYYAIMQSLPKLIWNVMENHRQKQGQYLSE